MPINTILRPLRSNRLALCVILLGTTTWMSGCKPDSLSGLGALPKPDFIIATGADANHVILVNHTSTPSIPYWTIVSATPPFNPQKFQGDSAKMDIIFAGTYNVTLLVAGNGGLDSVTKSVTISQNDPSACQNSTQGFIAGCTQKVWQLDPIDYAEEVGPTENDGSWFHTLATDVSGPRGCDFNDQYIFSFNAAGTFQFDNKGDFYADSYIANSNNDCETDDKLSGSQIAWGSGTFTYQVSSTGGSAGLGQLTVVGVGAHIGFPKVQGGGLNDNTTGPSVGSIAYDILSMTHNSAGNYDVLVLGVKTSYGGWTYTLRSY